MSRSHDPIECPNCGKEMRRRWSWFPFCSAKCVQENDEREDWDDAA